MAEPEHEQDLVARARGGDLDAFDELVRRYRDRVWRLGLRLGGSPEEAEEITQDAFLTAYDKLDTFRGDAAFGTWLYRITVNKALGRLRARRARGQTVEIGIEPDDTGAPAGREARALPVDEDDPAAREQLRRALERAIAELPDAYRAVFVLRDVEDLSTEEAAAALDLTTAAVKTRLHRARLALREKLIDFSIERFRAAAPDDQDGREPGGRTS